MWEVHYEYGREPWEPEGCVFLAWAFGEVMDIVQLQCLQAWQVEEPKIDWRLHLPLLDRRRDDLEPKHASKRDRVADWATSAMGRIAKAAYAGRFEGRCRHIEGGELLELKSSSWGIVDFWPRFASCALNLDSPYDLEAQPTHWIFLEHEGFSSFADDLRKDYGQEPIWDYSDEEAESGCEAPAVPSADIQAVATPSALMNGRRRRGRQPGVGGFVARDTILLPEIASLVRGGMSPWAATASIGDKIEGFTSDEQSKIKRVVLRYYERYDERGNELP